MIPHSRQTVLTLTEAVKIGDAPHTSGISSGDRNLQLSKGYVCSWLFNLWPFYLLIYIAFMAASIKNLRYERNSPFTFLYVTIQMRKKNRLFSSIFVLLKSATMLE